MRHTRLLIVLTALLIIAIPAHANDAQPCMANTVCDESATETSISTSNAGISLEKLAPETDLMHDRWYMRIEGTVPVYDAPNGNIKRTIDEGFNFVTALEQIDGWTKINGDEWVQSAHVQESNWVVSSFTGYELPDGLPENYTIAWALVNMYPSAEPGGDPSEDFDFIYRYTTLYIDEVATVDGHRWYHIGSGQWVHQFNVAKILPLQNIPNDVDTDKWIAIDLYEQTLTAYEGTKPVFATLVATGLDRWPTYEGTFNIYYRSQRKYMSWGTVGDDFYSLEEVPWTMFFDEGRALHGAYWHDGFGYRRSHGCVNMSITDAKWLYDWVADDMGSRASADVEVGPAVFVYSTDEYE